MSRKRKRSPATSNSSGRAQAEGSARRSSGADVLEHRCFFPLLYGAFLVVGLYVYGPVLNGNWISDDQHYVAQNIYVHDLGPKSILAILDPTGDPAKMVENYAPVHLLLHGIEWKLFGDNRVGYHVVNVAMHALASLLLVGLFLRCGVSRASAALAGAIFLLHPANVEAVAWISQLKTTSALVLALGALLSSLKRPGLGAVLFALALLAKPTAAVALFAFALFEVLRDRWSTEPASEAAVSPPRFGWVIVWAAIFVLFAIAEFWAFNKTAGQAPVFYEDLGVRLLTTCAISLRYLVMALSGYGISTFHEPPAVESFADPWFVGSGIVLVLFLWRWIVVLRARSLEAVFWLWTVVSFAPISGVIPLPFPMADRYLYFIMPGLIGAFLLMVPAIAKGIASRRALPVSGARALVAGRVLAAIAILVFANATFARSYVWLDGETMMADAERHYPQGLPAQTRIATRAALVGDVETTVRALRAANKRGYNRLDHLLTDPGYARVRSDPRFQRLLQQIAQDWLDRYLAIASPSELELRLIAQAQIVMGDLDAAIRAIESAIEHDGLLRDELQQDLENLLRTRRIRESVKKKSADS